MEVDGELILVKQEKCDPRMKAGHWPKLHVPARISNHPFPIVVAFLKP